MYLLFLVWQNWKWHGKEGFYVWYKAQNHFSDMKCWAEGWGAQNVRNIPALPKNPVFSFSKDVIVLAEQGMEWHNRNSYMHRDV